MANNRDKMLIEKTIDNQFVKHEKQKIYQHSINI